jgi:threonine dehydratase
MTTSVLIAGDPRPRELLAKSLLADRPAAAVAVGAGNAALTLAITASKLGIPVVAAPGEEARPDADAARILATLAELDARAEGERASHVIAAWLRERTPSPDLDSGA